MSAPRPCTVSFRDPEGLRHEVEVAASSLYEAVAAAIVLFRGASLSPCAPGALSELEVAVRGPSETHKVRVQRFEQWLRSGSKTPSEQSLKVRLRQMLVNSKQQTPAG